MFILFCETLILGTLWKRQLEWTLLRVYILECWRYRINEDLYFTYENEICTDYSMLIKIINIFAYQKYHRERC